MASNRCKLYTGGVHLVSDGRLNPEEPFLDTPFTFVSLPIEIRDQIYDLLLVSTSNIIVWKGERKYDSYGENNNWRGPRTRLKWCDVDEEATRACVRPLTMSLLRCNRLVGREAAHIFYAKNTFSFEGDHNFDPIVVWLQGLGLTNRSSLASLQINANRPNPAWQLSNGERKVEPYGFTWEEIYPLHPYLQLRSGEERPKYGRVDNINPSVELIFVLLGERLSPERKFQIIMQLPESTYPGNRLFRSDYETDPQEDWFSMDLPNLIEKSRSLHTRNIEVLWKTQDCRTELEEQQAKLESLGWSVEILPATQDLLRHIGWPPDFHGCPCHPSANEWRIANAVLRRKELTGILWADDPCPYIYGIYNYCNDCISEWD